jgi:hypothetical protein
MEDTETAVLFAGQDLDLVAPSTKAFQERYGVSVQSKAIGARGDCSCFFSLFLAVFRDLTNTTGDLDELDSLLATESGRKKVRRALQSTSEF